MFGSETYFKGGDKDYIEIRESVIFLTACVKFEGHFELSGTLY